MALQDGAPKGSCREGVLLLPEKSGFGVRPAWAAVRIGTEQGAGLVAGTLILCKASGLWLFCARHPINPLGEPQGRSGQVLNYLSSPHRCVRCTAKAHVTFPEAGGSARDFLGAWGSGNYITSDLEMTWIKGPGF